MINEQGDEIKKYRAERRGHLDRMNALKDRQRTLEGQKQSILKNIPRGSNYRDEQEMAKAIKEKQTKYETSSMSNQEEKALLREIDQLKKALPDIKALSKIEPELQAIREEKKKISGALDIVKRVLDDREEKIQGVKQAS